MINYKSEDIIITELGMMMCKALKISFPTDAIVWHIAREYRNVPNFENILINKVFNDVRSELIYRDAIPSNCAMYWNADGFLSSVTIRINAKNYLITSFTTDGWDEIIKIFKELK